MDKPTSITAGMAGPMLVTDVMSKPVITIPATANVEQAAALMLKHRIASLVLVDETGKAVGLVEEKDFMASEHPVPFSVFEMPKLWGRWVESDGLDKIYKDARATPLAQICRPELHSVPPSASLELVVSLMLKEDVKHVPVVEAGKAIGMVSRHDLLRALAG